MIPKRNLILEDIEKIEKEETLPSLTYKLTFIPYEKRRLNKRIDHKEALIQSIEKRLLTKKGVFPIYSPNYGLMTEDLIGMPKDYVKSELKIRIRETLLLDDRILDIYNFIFPKTKERNALDIVFTIDSIFESFQSEVKLNV